MIYHPVDDLLNCSCCSWEKRVSFVKMRRHAHPADWLIIFRIVGSHRFHLLKKMSKCSGSHKLKTWMSLLREISFPLLHRCMYVLSFNIKFVSLFKQCPFLFLSNCIAACSSDRYEAKICWSLQCRHWHQTSELSWWARYSPSSCLCWNSIRSL